MKRVRSGSRKHRVSAAPVAVLDQGMDLAGEQVDASQQAERAMALVLMITREGRVDADRRPTECEQKGRGRYRSGLLGGFRGSTGPEPR